MSELKEGKTIVSVPVTVTISVPVEIDYQISGENRAYSTELGCDIVDPLQCDEAVSIAIEQATVSDIVSKAFDILVSAALRYKESNPSIDIYMTPFAGLVPEQKL